MTFEETPSARIISLIKGSWSTSAMVKSVSLIFAFLLRRTLM
jgi:hypothetical protein